MGFYDDDFAAHDAGIVANDFGESVDYYDLNGLKTTDALALVDFEDAGGGRGEVETLRPSDGENGIDYPRVRRFGLRKSAIATVHVNGRVRYESQDWAITRIVDEDVARWYVECERRAVHEKARPGFRGGVR